MDEDEDATLVENMDILQAGVLQGLAADGQGQVPVNDGQVCVFIFL